MFVSACTLESFIFYHHVLSCFAIFPFFVRFFFFFSFIRVTSIFSKFENSNGRFSSSVFPLVQLGGCPCDVGEHCVFPTTEGSTPTDVAVSWNWTVAKLTVEDNWRVHRVLAVVVSERTGGLGVCEARSRHWDGWSAKGSDRYARVSEVRLANVPESTQRITIPSQL